MAQDSKTPSGNTMGDVIDNKGIVTQGQIGDNYIFDFKPPTVTIVKQLLPRKLDDGTYEAVVIFRIDSQAQANSLLVAIVKEDIIVSPPTPAGVPGISLPHEFFRLNPNGSGGVMMNLRTGEAQGYVFTKIQAPAKGEWVVGARIAKPETKVRIHFEVD